MGKKYLVDSNAIIDFLSARLPVTGMNFMSKVINDIPIVSVITQIEILGFNTSIKANQLLTTFIDDSIILGLSDEVVYTTINLRKGNKIKLPDAIIAATSLVNDLILISRNTKDFEKIKLLEVVNPYNL